MLFGGSQAGGAAASGLLARGGVPRRIGRPLTTVLPGGVDQRIKLLGGQVVVVTALVAHHGRELAGAHALPLFQAEEAVCTHLVKPLDTDPPLDVIASFVSPSQVAGEVGADVEVMLPDRLQVKQGVEGGDAFHVAGIKVQQLGDLGHGFSGEVAELVLGHVQRRQHRAANMGEARRQGADLLDRVLREGRHQRSTSPSTVSTVPMIAIMSAIIEPSDMGSTDWMFTKEAERNLTRRGLWVPSDTAYTPCSPRAPSTPT